MLFMLQLHTLAFPLFAIECSAFNNQPQKFQLDSRLVEVIQCHVCNGVDQAQALGAGYVHVRLFMTYDVGAMLSIQVRIQLQ